MSFVADVQSQPLCMNMFNVCGGRVMMSECIGWIDAFIL